MNHFLSARIVGIPWSLGAKVTCHYFTEMIYSKFFVVVFFEKCAKSVKKMKNLDFIGPRK